MHNPVSYHNTFKPRRPEMGEQTWTGALVRSKSFPPSRSFSTVNGDPSIRYVDNNNIQIIIEDIPRKTHEPDPVEAISDDADIATMHRSTKLELYEHALNNKWNQARAIYDEFPEMVRIPLTTSGDTALHVAVMANSSTFVEELVNLEYMTPEDLEIPNVDGNTAFCVAVMIGNVDCLFKIMIEKNENLPLIRGQDGMLPVHLTVLLGNNRSTRDLTSEYLLQKMAFQDIELLFFLAINSNMYDVATKLLEKYPKQLVVARNDRKETALHMLARQPSKEIYISSGQDHQLELLKELCDKVHQLEYHMILELINHPSVVLFDAVRSGNFEVVKWLLCKNNKLLLPLRDPETGRNLLHLAVLYRKQHIFNFILEMRTVSLLIRAVDKDRNNVLHLAAHQSEETSSSSRPNIQMQRELVWFKEVEKRVPIELTTMGNNDGKTPKDVFYASHRKLAVKVKEAIKATADSSMVVATLIASVAFAATLTVPGDKNNGWCIVFILSNAVALFTSSASIISFLSISTLRFAESESDFFMLHPNFTLGLIYFLIATMVIAMVIAFVAASFLIFDHIYKWVAYTVASLGLLPIILTFLGIQSSLFYGLRDYLLSVLERPVGLDHPRINRI